MRKSRAELLVEALIQELGYEIEEEFVSEPNSHTHLIPKNYLGFQKGYASAKTVTHKVRLKKQEAQS
ncbi:hypothetical protein [uncultured Endozoicomonas sp.]|uniref:hypothetical protein n=1 Tax=uncultured Endozoicomonas sp. TaxID=432652 RepID=UPI0026162806|nr:hypothetical protein [uncultured Endozoicomonas sp.]